MTRKKVKLSFIINDAARRASYKKRTKGLLKKVSELRTLCDVDACAFIYSPYDAEPEVYPSPLEAQRVLAQLRGMSVIDQSKKMVDQESFLRQRIAKAVDQIKKLRKDNYEKELTRLMHQGVADGADAASVLEGLTVAELNNLKWIIDKNLKQVAFKLEKVRETKRMEAAERAAAEEEEKRAAAAAEAAEMEKHRQRIMDLMLSMTKFNNNEDLEHLDHQIMNFSLGESSGQWDNP